MPIEQSLPLLSNLINPKSCLTRRADLSSGIHPFCITIDTEARDYLPHMYGAVNYAVIDEVRKLPLKVSDIYRRLTT